KHLRPPGRSRVRQGARRDVLAAARHAFSPLGGRHPARGEAAPAPGDRAIAGTSMRQAERAPSWRDRRGSRRSYRQGTLDRSRGNTLVHIDDERDLLGKLVVARITSTSPWYLIGEAVGDPR